MLCAVYVTYTRRGQLVTDRIAYNLLRADAAELAERYSENPCYRVRIESYPAAPFVAAA